MILKNRKILLIEDNQGDIWIVKEVFSDFLKTELVVKSNGIFAIEYLKESASYGTNKLPDLIILDLNLPGKNGEEILKELKGDSMLSGIPVIVMSTEDDKKVINKIYRIGANCFIVKPGNADDYVKVIESVGKFWLNTVRLPVYE
ncbi:response regulator [candidate division KSB1 bacterium]|nr:MAG: response regulator [candidate division KSB1 bacterium]